MKFLEKKRGQVTLFIILGILIAGMIILGFIFFRDKLPFFRQNYFQDVQDYYYSCLEKITEEGVNILSSRGGFIEVSSFESGSPFMPTSSELNFFGNPVPYWFYVSGNNLARKNVPTKQTMERELEKYITENIRRCDFKEMEERGYFIYYSPNEEISVDIKDEKIVVDLTQDISVFKGDKSSSFRNHKIEYKTKLGKFYDIAKKIYDYEMEGLFLENYTMDILYNYAPVTGVEIQCSPIVFNKEDIRKNLTQAISTNLANINFKAKKNDYFSKDLGIKIKDNVMLMYSPVWPTKIEIYGDEVAYPVGGGKGMEILGFCYVPYHFVYDIVYPVLIQVYDEKELFQFGMVVVIDKTQPREAIYKDDFTGEDLDICKNMVNDLFISTKDLSGNPVEADIDISCLNSGCFLGRTRLSNNIALLSTKVPPCVNAVLTANKEGYSSGKKIISTNEESQAELILKKKYKLRIDLGNVQGKAFVRFEGDDHSYSVVYPENREIELVESYYNISVMVFKNSTLVIPSFTEKRCFDIPASGIKGIFGKEEKKCVDVVIPEQKIENVLIGGGKGVDYFFEDELKNAKTILMDVSMFKEPTSLEEIADNYIKLEDSFVGVTLK
ncbi:MAG: hypothetical protein QXX68_02260 [Candidatus Pacearchaeota archaeon]